MLSDDVFRSKLGQTAAALKAWTGFVADVARPEVDEAPGTFRLALTPATPEACPVDVELREERRYDLAVGEEVYEDLPLDSLDDVLPLLEAVTAGRVFTRRLLSPATGALLGIESHILAEGRPPWIGRRLLDGVAAGDLDDAIIEDRHYVPYRRG
jgi:hypothetical protein